MDWDQILRAAVDGGAVMVLAIVSIYWNRKDAKAQADQALKWATDCAVCRKEERADKILMLQVVQQNTEANVALKEAVREMGRTVQGVGR